MLSMLELTARLELAKGFPKSFADFFLCHSDSCQRNVKIPPQIFIEEPAKTSVAYYLVTHPNTTAVLGFLLFAQRHCELSGFNWIRTNKGVADGFTDRRESPTSQ